MNSESSLRLDITSGHLVHGEDQTRLVTKWFRLSLSGIRSAFVDVGFKDSLGHLSQSKSPHVSEVTEFHDMSQHIAVTGVVLFDAL